MENSKHYSVKPLGKPKILVIQQYFYPDISAVSQLMFGLLSRVSDQFDIRVLTGSAWNNPDHEVDVPNEINGIKIHRIRTMKMGKKSLFHRLIEYANFYVGTAVHVLFSKKYDLVISMTTPPLIGFFAAFGNLPHRRRPLMHYVEDVYPELLFDMGMVSSPWFVRRLTVLSRFAYRHSERIITIGHYMQRKLAWNYGLDLQGLSIIENWVSDVDFQEPPPTSNEIRLLYSGNAGMAHDFTVLEDLLPKLAEDSRIHLEFVGGGNRFADLRQICVRELGDRAHFRGYVDKHKHSQVLASGAILIIAQTEETVGDILPSKLYSYLAAGRPILFLGPANSEIGELIRREGFGVVLEETADFTELSELIIRISEDRSWYEATCARIRTYFDEHHTEEIAAQEFRKIVEEVLK